MYKTSTVTFVPPVETAIDSDDLKDNLLDLSKLRKNDKVLGLFPVKTSLYMLGARGIDEYIAYNEYYDTKFLFLFDYSSLLNKIKPLSDDSSKLRQWLTTKAGRAPQLIDTTAIDETTLRFENYLYNRGYFHTSTGYTVNFDEQKKAGTVNYNVDLNTFYRMQNIYYPVLDKVVASKIEQIPQPSHLKPGEPFDVEYLQNERSRITTYLRDIGFYKFQKEYIYFEVDTASGDSLDIYVKVSTPVGDSVHHPYKIRNIFVYTNASKDFNTDTSQLLVTHFVDSAGGKLRSDYYLVRSVPKYNPRTISNSLFFNPGHYYNDSSFQKTIRAFTNTGIFKYVTLQIKEVDTNSYTRYMDLYVKLDPHTPKNVTTQINASTATDYLVGNSLTASYVHKNIFKSLDHSFINLSGGIEMILENQKIILNSTELSAGTGLSIPRFFWPLPFETPKTYYPKTNFLVNFDYIRQLGDFTLYNSSFEYNCTWFENDPAKQHIVKAPLPTVTIVHVDTVYPEFQQILNDNPLLNQTFEQQFITGYGYTWIYNSQVRGYHVHDNYFRGSMEINLPFSDFLRVDADYRRYLNINSSNRLIGRCAIGFARPFDSQKEKVFDTEVIPYVKQFFVGGGYSIRAFSIRKLGPGTFVNYDTVGITVGRQDQLADYKLELNLEYRFDIISFFEGALFCDFGNIWTRKYDPFRPGSRFEFSDFYKEIAVGPGAGLRMDFTVLVIRFDVAYPLYDPALDGEMGSYYIDYYNEAGFTIPQKNLTFNLAIGYPF